MKRRTMTIGYGLWNSGDRYNVYWCGLFPVVTLGSGALSANGTNAYTFTPAT